MKGDHVDDLSQSLVRVRLGDAIPMRNIASSVPRPFLSRWDSKSTSTLKQQRRCWWTATTTMSSSAELPGFAASVPVPSTVKPKSILKTTSTYAKKAEQQKTEKDILAKWTKPRENKRNQNSNGTTVLAKLPPVRTAADLHAGSATTASFAVASPLQLKAAAAVAAPVGPAFHLPAAESMKNAATAAVSGLPSTTTTTANSVNLNRTDNNRKRAAVGAPAGILVDVAAGAAAAGPEIAVAIPRRKRASTNTMMTRESSTTSEATAEFPVADTAKAPPLPPPPATMAASVGRKNLKPPPFAAMSMPVEQDDEDDSNSQEIDMEKLISQHMAATKEYKENSLLASCTEGPGEDEGSKKPAARIVAGPTSHQRQPSPPPVAPTSGGKSRADIAAIFCRHHRTAPRTC
jgi:hypothetical protein